MSEAEARPSKKQRELLTFIEGFIAQHGYGPSYREVMRALSYKSVSTVAIHIENLIKKGHLRKRDKSARSLELCAGSSAEVPGSKPVDTSEEKWLIDAVGAKFAAAETDAASVAELDGLYVLIGALHVLGFSDAARSYQGRLQNLKQQLVK
jgi:SOS-response transcriptional repressor LexA